MWSHLAVVLHVPIELDDRVVVGEEEVRSCQMATARVAKLGLQCGPGQTRLGEGYPGEAFPDGLGAPVGEGDDASRGPSTAPVGTAEELFSEIIGGQSLTQCRVRDD